MGKKKKREKRAPWPPQKRRRKKTLKGVGSRGVHGANLIGGRYCRRGGKRAAANEKKKVLPGRCPQNQGEDGTGTLGRKLTGREDKKRGSAARTLRKKGRRNVAPPRSSAGGT